MNLLLFAAHERTPQNTLILPVQDRRATHITQVLQLQLGDTLEVGQINAGIGQAKILAINSQHLILDLLSLNQAAPPALPVTLILALPRPRMLARSLEHMVTLGVKHLVLLHTARVQKSYWQSPELKEEKIAQHIQLGLEQAKDTVWPHITYAPLFKPFVEDVLPEIIQGKKALFAHPHSQQACPRGLQEACVLVIGPEGGLVPYEVDLLTQAGLEGVHLGPRILRVETAVTALLARLF
ncbi:RNA methyltransferase, RsmE family [Allopseudospirillum japonicum]|uniref:Ribosomal RNA small subunit methyltransferase E n=1 Tax=Allopseudospirillum japonicum TaxID=64971 RepID=A0A1H6TAF7_9GAMM|nr:16S rRNA (uracil(1498)-N(3))-methyltransferase [Allopseudospirillum japonicum]SEI75144.1 RNA methyltransferase, RsmE family [Allopseudospirillum japonicum]